MTSSLTIHLPDERATSRFGARLADHLGAGDFVCLSGDLGAGKSHLARAIIQTFQARAGRVEDVPSPTYTLVQNYVAGDLAILHADLYRLGNADEWVELGLDDGLGDALCLVEWPDRLGDATPPDALWIELHPRGDGRSARISGAGWAARLQGLKDSLDA